MSTNRFSDTHLLLFGRLEGWLKRRSLGSNPCTAAVTLHYGSCSLSGASAIYRRPLLTDVKWSRGPDIIGSRVRCGLEFDMSDQVFFKDSLKFQNHIFVLGKMSVWHLYVVRHISWVEKSLLKKHWKWILPSSSSSGESVSASSMFDWIPPMVHLDIVQCIESIWAQAENRSLQVRYYSYVRWDF